MLMTAFSPLTRRTVISALVALPVFCLPGCAPYVSKYRYISLEEAAGVQITAHSKAAIENLFFHEPMPVSYQLARDSYTLDFNVDKLSYLPSMLIEVTFEESKNGTFKWLSDGPSLCRTYNYPDENSKRKIRYTWMGCKDVEETNPQNFLIRIDDESGNTIAEEVIPFTLKSNGFYVVLDAI